MKKDLSLKALVAGHHRFLWRAIGSTVNRAIMPEITEQPEAVTAAGTVKLVETVWGTIVSVIARLFYRVTGYRDIALVHNPHGDGLVAGRIVGVLARELLEEKFCFLRVNLKARGPFYSGDFLSGCAGIK
jgi:hypothetical protein